MMLTCETKTIEQVVKRLIDYRGRTPTKSASGIRLVTAKVIKDGFIQDDTAEYISEATYASWMRRGYPQLKDIVMTTEAPLGEVAQIRTPERVALAQRVILLRGNSDVIDQQYLFHTLKSPYVQAGLQQRATGTTVLGIRQSELRQVKIPYYPVPIQRKIASILSTYDDLIENNLRRIKILEEMARNLYREWFVKFRFPAHEETQFVDSSLGRIPEGWEVVTFTEIADVLSGGTPKTTVQEYWGGSIPFFTPKDAPGYVYVTDTAKSITKHGLQKCNSKLYPKDTVFITARGTVGKVVMTSMDMAMNQSCYALQGKQGIDQIYLFWTIKEQIEYLKKNSGGATFDTIVVDTFQRMLIAKPCAHLIARFSEMVRPMMALVVCLLRKNNALRRTRDLLLPRLISGELDVADLDITVPEEA